MMIHDYSLLISESIPKPIVADINAINPSIMAFFLGNELSLKPIKLDVNRYAI
jgi:hypothetical protein